MANPNQIHLEGPNPEKTVDITVNGNVKNGTTSTDDGENRLQQYDLLRKQVENGQYDGDGPADVAPTCQEEVC